MKSRTVTATEANRSFSRLLDAVRRGERVEITSHGRKLAVLSPAESDSDRDERRAAAYAELRRHWQTVKPVTVGSWTREDLNARD
jgi:prevent-host-death family protein